MLYKKIIEMINRFFLYKNLNAVTIFIICFSISCTKEPIIEPNTSFESPREQLEIKERDSIIGEYFGNMQYYDENLVVGNEIDTTYFVSFEVVKHGIDSIRIIPPLPLMYPEISNEFFKYDSSNFYSDYYTTTYTGYDLKLKFKPDSSKMEFRTSFSVGIDYDNHFHEFSGEKN